MRVPISWLREFTDCELPVDEIARKLTLGGLEVEAIERIGIFSHDVVVGEIVRAEPHPRSDQLRVVEVDVGQGKTETAVTGAPNIEAGAPGLKVPAARSGAVLIDPKAEGFDLYTVASRPVLGVDSSIVLCSEKELGLSDDHRGVLELEPSAVTGAPVFAHRPPPPDALADIVLDIAILPSQGRCLSIIGVARELAALTRSSFRLSLDAEYVPLDAEAFDIEIRDPDLCPRYSGYVLEDLDVRPSPLWMQRRLVLAGHKPYNNLVDVTNYILAEMGQPMHAFDLDRLPARNIIVRRATPDEKMHTLDQKIEDGTDGEKEPPRTLDDSVLLITSGDQPVAVGGVIGGLESQIYPDTRSVLLEAANFDPVSIRRTMSLLKVTTESSVRFSRGVDPALTVPALQRAAHLLKEVAGARPEGAIADRYPLRRAARELEVPRATICRTLGMNLSAEEMAGALRRLGFEVDDSRSGEETITVGIPGYRSDVEIPADIAEEVIRVVGFDRLPATRLAEPLPRQARNASWETRFELRDYLVGAGLQDTIAYSLTTRAAEKLFLGPWQGEGTEPPYVEVINPASQERTSMRRTLLSGLMDAVVRNHRHRPRIALFEIGPVWLPEHGDGTLPQEPQRLGIVLSGPAEEPSWMAPQPREVNFFDLKGYVEGLIEKLHVENASFRPVEHAPFHPGIAAEIWIGERFAGVLGQIHPDVIDALDLDQRKVYAAELDLDPWIEVAQITHAFRPFSRYPAVRQDLALVVDEDLPAESVETAIREAAGPLLVDIRLFDLYRGEQMEAGKKSLAYELTFCAEDRSLEEEEVNSLRESILPELEEKVGARLR